MRNQKGFSFVELLCVLVMIALIIALTAPKILGQIDRARADNILVEARTVYIAAQATLTYSAGLNIPDRQLTEGLTGLVDDIIAFPIQTEISRQLNAYLAPSIKLSDTASETEGKVSFFIENGMIKKVVYEKILGNKLRIATLEDGEGKVKSQKVVKEKE